MLFKYLSGRFANHQSKRVPGSPPSSPDPQYMTTRPQNSLQPEAVQIVPPGAVVWLGRLQPGKQH